MTPEEAYNYAAALCNKAEYCRSEIISKLRNKGLDPADMPAVIQRLEEQRLIDDRRYAMAFARQKFRNQYWGRRKIEIELRRKRITPDSI
ncbi:MAG: RecX family transcriptional regulator, partial [Muribaculaceae bacterium]|nr:RecX family transcriptional regulator [Muribaculaceae bacterium]